jgi:hypothetical protein
MPPAIFASAAVCLFLLCGAAFAAVPVVIERDTTLMAEPRLDSVATATLREGTSADATVRRGPWLAVRTAHGSGWVLSFNVRYRATGSTVPGAEPSLVNGLNTMTGRNVTATIGIRGLDREDRKQVGFDAQQMSLLEKSRATDAQARAAAASAGLRAHKVEFLEER